MPGLWAQACAALRPHPESAGDATRDHSLEDRMRLYNASALSLAVLHEGELVVEEGIGTLAADDPTDVTTSTVFSACSVSKGVTAVGALRLVAQGWLALDADVNQALHDWRVCDAQGREVRVTLRQLLTHTAGTNVHGAVCYDPSGPVPTLDDVFYGRRPSLTPAVKVASEPGTAYRYSSGGYVVIQKLICDATGQAFADAMDSLVFKPLSMCHSSFRPPSPNTQHAAAHVSLLRRAAAETALAWPELAAAGLWTTAGDLARLILAVQQSHGGDTTFLPCDLARDALQRQTPHRDIGLGLYLLGVGDSRRFSHTGAHLGWRAEMMGWLSGGYGMAVMINNGYTGSELKSEIVGAVVRTYGWPA